MTARSIGWLATLICGAATVAGAEAPPPAPPSATTLMDPGFEAAPTGSNTTPGWRLTESSAKEGVTLVSDPVDPHDGAASLKMNVPGSNGNAYGIITQSIEASAYRGKVIRLTMWLRTSGEHTRAGAWLRVDRAKGEGGFFDNMEDRAIGETQWTRVQITGPVAADAEKIFFGVLSRGSGDIWADSANIEVVGDNLSIGHEPPRALTARGRANLTAFARLYGDVRWFHPSDQAAVADWDQVALAGVQKVEGARSPAELAEALRAVFEPLAPTLQIYPNGKAPPLPPDLTPREASVTAWRHQGVQWRNTGAYSPYHSERVVSGTPAVPAGGVLWQELDAAPLKGHGLHLAAFLRAEGGASGRLALSGKTKGGPWRDLAVSVNAVTGGEWTPLGVDAKIPADVDSLAVMVRSQGPGAVDVDDVVAAYDNGQALAVGNGDFEWVDGATGPQDWFAPERGYRPHLVAGHGGGHAGRLAFEPETAAALPKPSKPVIIDLGSGLTARLASGLYLEGGHTLPARAARAPLAPDKPQGYLPAGEDRTTRLADVVIVWTATQHFWPYFDVRPVDWPAALPAALDEAALGPDDMAFDLTLKRLLAPLHDGHGFSGANGGRFIVPAPISWDWIENRLVITWVRDAGLALKPGDVVTTIDAKPVSDQMARAAALVPASTEGNRRYRALNDLLDGPKGAILTLGVTHADGTSATVTTTYSEPRITGEIPDQRPDKITELKPGLMYVNLGQANGEEIDAAMPRLAAAKGVLFDLRGYPKTYNYLAHLTDKPYSSAYWRVPVATRPDHQPDSWNVSRWHETPVLPRITGHVVFITDERAVSFAESVMGIVEAYRMGDIVGHATAGTNGNINPMVLPGGFSAMWTGMQVIKHDGTRHMGVGIKPTIPVERTIAGVAAGRDELLEKAIEVASKP